ncbi:type 4a pilus biogenesis protein PilO [Chondromyces apiculatus]|uniref:Type IV pilus biogenesis protein PilO n=1 Tax=Chondromyces apiculatus DSM 436 TaxID=1192034 RepID=A0A017T9Z5_9BACT|nr:type 4a pilus biogenesis protein PilO [Chondromyces apiculatus]EYF05762.1 Type IV pilus biogenesis protein PilO [Chondromyces apiculatus DSM 436]
MAQKTTTTQSGLSLDRLSPVAKVAIGAVFMALIGALYFIGFYTDVSSQIEGAQNRTLSLQSELSKAQASKEAYQKDLDEKTRREQLSREQKKILPDESETPAFLSAIQGVATVSGVNLTSWSPTEEIPQEFFAKVPMKLSLSGKFHQVAKFFYGVGQLDRIINVENIQIKKKASRQSEPRAEDVEVDVECLATAFRAVKAGEGAGTNPKRQQRGAPKQGGH